MKQITETVYEWSQYDPERRIDVNGHFVQAAPGEPGVLIDPVSFHPGDEAQIRELGGVAAVMLSSVGDGSRVHQAARCRELFGGVALVPASDLQRVSLPGVEPFSADSSLPAGLVPIALAESGTLGEMAFHQPGTLFVGRAVIGAPAGGLSLPDKDGEGDQAGAARNLRACLTRPFTRLLVGEGTSVLQEAARQFQNLIYQHDPAACILRQEEISWGSPNLTGSLWGFRAAECARLLGLTAIDFDVKVIPSGRQNYPLHRHDAFEELFIVLEGTGELRTEKGTFPIKAGDMLGFPPRFQVAHAIGSTGDGDLTILSFAARAEELEMIDYPDTGQFASNARFGKRRRFFLPERTNVGYWEGTQVE